MALVVASVPKTRPRPHRGVGGASPLLGPGPEDEDLRRDLARLGPPALRELREVLGWPRHRREDFLRLLIARPAAVDLATVIAICDREPVARLRVLRAIRDLAAVPQGVLTT